MCVNCNDSLQVNLPVAPSGLNGTDGESAYVYIATANDNTGGGFSYPMNPTQPYIAIINSTTPIVNPAASNFTGQWHYWVGPSGSAGTNGTNGTNGADGVNGAISVKYKWDANVGTPPSPTFLRTNNANPASATQLYVHFTDLSNNNVQALLALAWSSTSSTKSVIVITKKNNPNEYISYQVTSNGVIGGSYWIFFVNYVSSSASFSATTNTEMVFSFSIIGDKGTTGATGPQGPTGLTGPIGPAGGANLTRPGSNTSYSFNNYLITDQGSTPTNYFQYSGGTGTPASGAFKCFDSTGAATAVKSDVTMIIISSEDAGATSYSGVMAGISTNGTINFDTPAGDVAIYDVIDAVYTAGSPGYLTIYVDYVSGAGSFASGLSGHYDVELSSQYSLVLANQNYNRILLNNTGTVGGVADANLITLRAPQSATVGTLMVVEVGAAGGTNDLYITYGYNESGATSTYSSTLSVAVDYTKSTSHNTSYAASSPISIKLDTGGQSALLQFYVVASNVSPYKKSLAFMGGNIYSR